MKLLNKIIVILLEIFFSPVFNIMASFANVAFITASTCKPIKQNIIQK